MEINSFFLDLIPYLIPLLMIGIGSALDIDSFQNLLKNSKSSLPFVITPLSFIISHITADGSFPANLLISTAASVCPALTRTPPSLAFKASFSLSSIFFF